ncbi:hypothetical protein BUQ74_07960 [Leptospira weilii serovar Heyan]|nr:hypothetical protein BUQ74_07960 [Leptospira weilii serovar Heyan]
MENFLQVKFEIISKRNPMESRFLFSIELLKNSMMKFHKTASIVHFNETETNGTLIFQQL